MARLLVRAHTDDEQAEPEAAAAEDDEVPQGARSAARVAECVELLTVGDERDAQDDGDGRGDQGVMAHALDERADREEPHGRLPGAPFTPAQASGEHHEQQSRGERGGAGHLLGEARHVGRDALYAGLLHVRGDRRRDVQNSDDQARVTCHGGGALFHSD